MKGLQGFGNSLSRAAFIITAAISLALTACSSGGGGDYDSAWVGDIESDFTVTGSVGDGPAANASVVIRQNNGEELTSLKSDASGGYNVELSVSQRHFPLLVDATGGTDIVTDTAPDFVMRSAVLSAEGQVTANVNPFSTFAYEIAKDMNGGLTKENLIAAENIAVTSLNSGLASLAISGPMRTPVDESNVAEMIRASETVAEIVRRTRDALNAAGHTTDADAVIATLASDLIDKVIEGNGGPRADARTAAVANIATAQVVLEAMTNQLHVNGSDATEAMRSAIQQVVSGTAQPSLDELGITRQMINQANVGLSAAFAMNNNGRIAELMQSVSGLQHGMETALVRTMIASDHRASLSGLADKVASSDPATLELINSVARSSESNGSAENRAPTISGQPATTVRAGSRYEFVPTASDLDEDSLTFSIVNQPSWASFDPASGALTGTPQVSDAGTYEGVTITVSDGSLSADVGPFAIAVTTSNSGPTISGSPATQVAAGDSYSFTPTATDPDSSTLRFSITGKPAWADFDVLTGRLSGATTDGDVGNYPGIVISVSDGTDTVSLPAFSIEVVAAGSATGSVTLRWIPPTENVDGTPLTDLAKYRIYWGRAGESFGPPVTINNPSVTRYVVENLTPGTYEVVATAVNSAGVESRFSNMITETVR
jgi:hypothetical protein